MKTDTIQVYSTKLARSELSENQYIKFTHNIVMLISLCLKWTDILHVKEMSCSELSENSFNSSLLHKIVMLIFLYLKLTDIFSDVSYQEVEEVAGYEVEEVEGYEVEEVEWEEEWIEEEVEDEEDEDVEDQEEEEDEDDDQVDEREGEQEKRWGWTNCKSNYPKTCFINLHSFLILISIRSWKYPSRAVHHLPLKTPRC